MTAEHFFQTLGLAPGRHDSGTLARRFRELRAEALHLLASPDTAMQGEARLDALHLAYRALSAQTAATPAGADALGDLRALIAASLEDGLLRYSRRQQILEAGRAAGLSDFQTQLVIAQVQFGDDHAAPALPAQRPACAPRRRTWPFLTAAALLGLAGLLAEIWWVR